MPLLAPSGSLRDLFLAWQHLPVFRSVDWSRIELRVQPRTPRYGDLQCSTGEALVGRGGRGHVLVRVGYDVFDGRMTLLHEMSHVREWRCEGEAAHGFRWRRAFAAACAEATGCYPLVGYRSDLDRAVRTLMRRLP